MTNTISKIWTGTLAPVEKSGIDNSKIRRVRTLMLDCLEELEKSLNDTQKACFEKYDGYVSEYVFLISEQSFCDGFCAGAKITAEAMLGAEDIV